LTIEGYVINASFTLQFFVKPDFSSLVTSEYTLYRLGEDQRVFRVFLNESQKSYGLYYEDA
jgi:hypothetical protein